MSRCKSCQAELQWAVTETIEGEVTAAHTPRRQPEPAPSGARLTAGPRAGHREGRP
jgi:hypothetical protein